MAERAFAGATGSGCREGGLPDTSADPTRSLRPGGAGIRRLLVSAGTVLATQCVAGPITCESSANPVETCAQLDGARFIDAGTDGGESATVDASIDGAWD